MRCCRTGRKQFRPVSFVRSGFTRPFFTTRARRNTERPEIFRASHCTPCREKKCSAGFQPAKVLLAQKELSRLRCRRDAGATIFSHDPCLRGECKFGWGVSLCFGEEM